MQLCLALLCTKAQKSNRGLRVGRRRREDQEGGDKNRQAHRGRGSRKQDATFGNQGERSGHGPTQLCKWSPEGRRQNICSTRERESEVVRSQASLPSFLTCLFRVCRCRCADGFDWGWEGEGHPSLEKKARECRFGRLRDRPADKEVRMLEGYCKDIARSHS